MKQLTVCVIATSVSINNYSSFAGLIGHTGMISSTPVRTLLDLSGPFKNYNYPYRPIRNLMAPSGSFLTFQYLSRPVRTLTKMSGPMLYSFVLSVPLPGPPRPFRIFQDPAGPFRILWNPSGSSGNCQDLSKELTF